MKKYIAIAILALIAGNAYCQTMITSASTSGLKYPLLEAAVGAWSGYVPDADQDVIQIIEPTYPRAIIAFWHNADPMMLTGDPFCTGTGYIPGLPSATIDRVTFGGAIGQPRPWESFVGTQNATVPLYDVTVTCKYNTVTKVISVQVTGAALTTLSGNWNINAYVVEDSISSGLSSAYNQASYFDPPGSVSCTGSPSWYIGDGNPITSGSKYSHMQVVRAILCTGASVWGEPAFTSPTLGTSITKTYSYTIPSISVPKNIKIIGMVAKYGATTSDREIENAIETTIIGPLAGTLLFTGGHTQTSSVCENSGTNSINSLLAANDSYTGTTVNWTVYSGASHGTLVAAYSTTSTGGILTPTGLSYTPTPGYTGPDSYTIIVSDGALADTTTVSVNVLPAPSPITGITSLCTGSTSTLSSAPTGGTWTSSVPGVATIGPISSVLTGLSAGTSLISYTLSSGCASSVVAVVSASPSAGTITGLSNVCVGATISLTDGIPGGTWSSGSGGVATIGGSSGMVTGTGVGTAVITYSVTFSCGSATTTKTITVGPAPIAGAIAGTSTVCTGTSSPLSDAATSGVWTAANGNATVSGTGVVFGVTPGTDVITYTVTNSCGSAMATTTITINHCPLNISTVEQTEWNIYPNPVKTQLTLTSSVLINNVTISNLAGQEVYSREPRTKGTEIDVANLPAGVYFIKINGSEVRKFRKE